MQSQRPKTHAPAPRILTLEMPALEVSLHGSSQQRSRVLGQEEHNVMLALGLVRAAARTLLALEPLVLRACELLERAETPRENAARNDLRKLLEELSRAIDDAVFDGDPLFQGGSSMFDVEDTHRNGEPLKITLPDLAALAHGEQGLEEYLARRRTRAEADQMADALRSGLTSGKTALREAEQQLSVLLTHFHRQRGDHPRDDSELDLAQTAARLGERVLKAGKTALAAQGELSTRASSLVLNDRTTS